MNIVVQQTDFILVRVGPAENAAVKLISHLRGGWRAIAVHLKSAHDQNDLRDYCLETERLEIALRDIPWHVNAHLQDSRMVFEMERVVGRQSPAEHRPCTHVASRAAERRTP